MTKPLHSLKHPTLGHVIEYRRSEQTDIRETFAKVRARMIPAKNVRNIQKVK